MSYTYIIQAPDGKIRIKSDVERDENFLSDWVRENYAPKVPLEKEAARGHKLPSGVMLDIATDDGAAQFLTTSKGGLVPIERFAQGFSLVQKLQDDGSINEEQAKQLSTEWAESFATQIQDTDERGRRKMLEGFRRSGLGSYRTLMRLTGGPGATVLPTPFSSVIPQERLPAREMGDKRTFDGARKELADLARINALPDSEGFGGTVVDFGFNVLGSLPSFENLVNITPQGALAKKLVGKAATSLIGKVAQRGALGAAENVAAETLIQPLVQEATRQTGGEVTWGSIASDYLVSAAGGAALRNVFGGFGDIFSKFKVKPKEFDAKFTKSLSEGKEPVEAMAEAAGVDTKVMLEELSKPIDPTQPLRTSLDLVNERLNQLRSQAEIAMQRARDMEAPARTTATAESVPPVEVAPAPRDPRLATRTVEPTAELTPQTQGFTGGEALRTDAPVVDMPGTGGVKLSLGELRGDPAPRQITLQPQTFLPEASSRTSIFTPETLGLAERVQQLRAMASRAQAIETELGQIESTRQSPQGAQMLREELGALQEALGEAPQPFRETFTPAMQAEPSARAIDTGLTELERARRSPTALASLREELGTLEQELGQAPQPFREQYSPLLPAQPSAQSLDISLSELERIRRSPEGAQMLRDDLAAAEQVSPSIFDQPAAPVVRTPVAPEAPTPAPAPKVEAARTAAFDELKKVEAERSVPEVGEVVARDVQGNEFVLAQGLLEGRPDMYTVAVRAPDGNLESFGFGHNTNPNQAIRNAFERSQDLEPVSQAAAVAKKSVADDRSSAMAKKEAEALEIAEQKAVVDRVKEDLEKQIDSAPKGKRSEYQVSETKPDGTDAMRTVSGTVYGNFGVEKIAGAKKSTWDVTHIPTGKRAYRAENASGAKRAAQALSSLPDEVTGGVMNTSKLTEMADMVSYVRTNQPSSRLIEARDKTGLTRAFDWADGVIKDQQGKLSANPMFDPALISAYALKGAQLAGKGAMKFADWSRQMVRSFGPWIQNSLKSIWDRMGEIKTNIKSGLIWHRYDFLDRINKIIGAKDLETKLQLAEPRAMGKFREFQQFEMPRIRELAVDGANKLGVTEERLRKLASDLAQAKQALAINKVHGDGAAGQTNQQALGQLDGLSPKIVEATDPYIQAVKELNRNTLDILRHSGMITDELYIKLRDLYPDYVPTQKVFAEGELEETMAEALIQGKGLASSGIQRTKGFSERANRDIFEVTLEEHQKALLRAEQNMSNLAVLDHFRENTSEYADEFGENVFQEVKPKIIGTTKMDTPKGKIEIPQYQEVPQDAIQIFENGKRVWLRVKDKVVYNAIARNPFLDPNADKQTRTQQITNGFISFMRRANAMRSYVLTTANPYFAPKNLVRDTQESWFNLQRMMGDLSPSMARLAAENTKSMGTLLKVQLATMGDSTSAFHIRKLFKNQAASLADKDDVLLYRQFMRDGGSAGSRAKFAADRMSDELRRIRTGTTGTLGFRDLGGVLESYNMIMEDASRFSSYKLAIEKGFDRNQAASMARDISFDPSKSGWATPLLSAFKMFVSPASQGAYNALRTSAYGFRNRDGKLIVKDIARRAARIPIIKLAAGLSMLKTAEYTWNQQFAGEEWNDEIGPFGRDFNLSFYMGKETVEDENGVAQERDVYTRIPLAHAFLPYNNVTNETMRAMFGYAEKSAADLISGVVGSTADGYLFLPMDHSALSGISSVLGGEAATSSEVVDTLIDIGAPDAFKPIFDLATNRNWLDQKIVPEYMGNDSRANEFMKFYDNFDNSPTGQFLVGLAKDLHDNAKLDISPQAIQYMLDSYLGGFFKLPKDVTNFVKNTAEGKDMSVREMMGVNIFLTSVDKEIAKRNEEVSSAADESLQQYANHNVGRRREERKTVRSTQAAIEQGEPTKAQEAIRRASDMGVFSNPDGSFNKDTFKRVLRSGAEPRSELPGRWRYLEQFQINDRSRASEIYNVIMEMPVEERGAFVEMLESENILTEQVKMQMMQMQR